MEVWRVRYDLSAPWVTFEPTFWQTSFSPQLTNKPHQSGCSNAVFIIKACVSYKPSVCVDQHGGLVSFMILSLLNTPQPHFPWRWVVSVNHVGRNTSTDSDGSEAPKGPTKFDWMCHCCGKKWFPSQAQTLLNLSIFKTLKCDLLSPLWCQWNNAKDHCFHLIKTAEPKLNQLSAWPNLLEL